MKKILFAVMFLAMSVAAQSAFAFGGCEEDCTKCHSIQKNEVKDILAKLNSPNTEVIDVKMSPVKGLWEATLEDGGRRGIIYIPFSKQYIVTGQIFEISSQANRTHETMSRMQDEKPRFVDVSKIPVDKALLMGRQDAQYKAIVFTDPDCPFCGRLHEELKKVAAERADIAFHIKFLPLPMHKDAHWKSETILCKGSLALLEDNFAKKEIPRPDCKTTEPDDNIKLAESLGITGTPTMVMPNGAVIVGARDAKTLIDLITKSSEKTQEK